MAAFSGTHIRGIAAGKCLCTHVYTLIHRPVIHSLMLTPFAHVVSLGYKGDLIQL